MAKGKEAARQTGEAIVKSILPDYCYTPVGALRLPIPYQIIAPLDVSVRTETNVRMKGFFAFTLGARVARVIGDEPGIFGGVISGVNRGFCRPATHYSKSTRAGGKFIIHHQSRFWMNCNGPEGPGNTVGMLIYVKVQGYEMGNMVTKEDMENALTMMMNSQTDRGWWNKVNPEFERRVRSLARELNVDPNALMAGMAFETGGSFGANVWNLAGSQAVGLIQFIPQYLPMAARAALGTLHPDLANTPFRLRHGNWNPKWTPGARDAEFQFLRERLASMTPEAQLDIVGMHLMQYQGRIHNVDDVYMAIHYPAAVGKGDDFVLYERTIPEGQPGYENTTYARNRGLDKDGNGKVTKAEACAKVRELLAAQQKIEQKGGVQIVK